MPRHSAKALASAPNYEFHNPPGRCPGQKLESFIIQRKSKSVVAIRVLEKLIRGGKYCGSLQRPGGPFFPSVAFVAGIWTRWTSVSKAGPPCRRTPTKPTMGIVSWLPVAPPTSSWKSGPHENTDEYPLPPRRSLFSHEGVSIPLLNLIYEYHDCLPGLHAHHQFLRSRGVPSAELFC